MQSKNIRVILVIGIIVSMFSVMWLPSTQATRPSSSELPLCASSYYEFYCKSFGNYAVVQRSINFVYDGSITENEASWIVLIDLRDGTETNITPPSGSRSAGRFYNSMLPSIDGDHVIYSEHYTTSSLSRLMMYNISTGDTWDVSLSFGDYGIEITDTDICGDWLYIQYSYIGVYRAKLINFETGIQKAFNPTPSTIYNIGNIALSEEYFSYTFTAVAGGAVTSWLFNITSYARIQITPPTGYTTVYIRSLVNNYGIMMAKNATSYADLCILDISSFQAGNTSDDYTFYEQNISIVGWSGEGEDNWIGVSWWYGDDNTNLSFANITAWNFINNENVTIASGYCNQILDYKNGRVFFATNKNSDVTYQDARDNWDVYYTETSLTAMMDGLMDVMLPMIIVVVVIGLLGAFFAFKMN
jgi:hypothetical protein